MTDTQDLDQPLALPADDVSTAALNWVLVIEARPVANHIGLTERGSGSQRFAATAIHTAHTRLAMARTLTDAIVEQARARPEKAPRYTLPDELLRERTEHGVTAIETATANSRWGEESPG